MRAEAAAPSLLPKVGDLRELIQNGKNAFSKARRQAVKVASQAVFAGTLQYTRDKDGNLHQIEGGVAEGVVFSDDELRKLFKLDQQAIDIYRESRAAIDTSLDDVTRSTLFKLLRKSALNPLLVENLRETSASLTSLKQTIGAALTRVAQDQERSGNTSQAARILKLAKLADDVIDKAESLKARGYAPLMRFGNYAVDVTDSKGDRIAFQLFESQLEANRAAFKLAKAYPQAKVRQSILSESGYKLFKGMTPETVALFAKELGVDKDEATQEYLQLAVSNRSALKRMIHRKGVEGYCDDLSRVVASFIVSNARQASGNFNRVEMLEAAEACKGDVKDEAVSLVQYLTEPKEEAA
ncbi:PLxRFG domain-containing protein, partial [Chitinimonas sp. PSY-7]|uniref:PLxRFG domain-containing protein n=1 Tax=Chitinimonas sp. PSY-7 TaxID=3459088 RepID=UPI00404004DD